jgi:VanZ family protein
MRALRYSGLWLGLGILMMAGILALALLPMPPMPVAWLDQYRHVLAFTALTVWFSGVVEDRRLGLLVMGLLGYGVLIEWLQHFTTYRHGQLADLVPDSVGIAMGLVLAFAGLRTWCIRVESWLQ